MEPSKNVYEGKPDARQGDASTVTSRFRPKYRALNDEEKQLHDAIKSKAEELEALITKVNPNGARYISLSLTALEESVMWAVKQLTA